MMEVWAAGRPKQKDPARRHVSVDVVVSYVDALRLSRLDDGSGDDGIFVTVKIRVIEENG